MSPLLAAAYVIFVLTVLYLLLELRRHLDAMFGITWSLPAMLAWLAVTGGLALSGFFEVFDAVPPRFGVAIAPALLTAIVLATRPRVSAYLDSQPLERFITRRPSASPSSWCCGCSFSTAGTGAADIRGPQLGHRGRLRGGGDPC